MSRRTPRRLGERTRPQTSVAGSGTTEAAAQLGLYIVTDPVYKPVAASIFQGDSQNLVFDGTKPEGPAELLLNFDQDPPVDQAAGPNSPHPATKLGSVTSNDGAVAIFGTGGIAFDGADDGLSFPDSSSWDILDSGNDFWISFRFRATLDGTGNFVPVMHGDATDNWRVNILDDGAGGRRGRLSFIIRVGGADTIYSSANNDEVLTDTWHEIHVERYNGTLYLSVDGEPVYSIALAASNVFTAPLYVGTFANLAWFDFDMDNLVIAKGYSQKGRDYFVRNYPWEDFDNL